jgi:hypothetical protein
MSRETRTTPAGREPIVYVDIAALNPSAFCEALPKSRQALLGFRIVLRKGDQRADAPHVLAGLLSARRERPRNCAAAKQRDEFATPHAPLHYSLTLVVARP